MMTASSKETAQLHKENLKKGPETKLFTQACTVVQEQTRCGIRQGQNLRELGS